MMPNADAIALGKQIKAVRKAMGMTQDQLALKSHVSVKYIANIENGKQNPSFDILSAILHVLPLSLDSIINPNLSELESECREWDAIYLACPPEMRKTLLEATRSLAIHLTEFRSRTKTPEPPARTLRTFLAFFCLNTQYCIRLLHKTNEKQMNYTII